MINYDSAINASVRDFHDRQNIELAAEVKMEQKIREHRLILLALASITVWVYLVF